MIRGISRAAVLCCVNQLQQQRCTVFPAERTLAQVMHAAGAARLYRTYAVNKLSERW
jgi:hypothetical protein